MPIGFDTNGRFREVGEIDSMIFRLDGEPEFTPLQRESTIDALLSELKKPDKFRTPLADIIRHLVHDTSTFSLPMPLAEAKVSFKFRRSESIRLVIDLWSNSDERELWQTVATARTLFKQFKSGVSVDTLACVYPALENRRAYTALRNSIVFGQSRFYGITHAPRIETQDNRCEAILGLRSGIFAFLST